MATRTWNRDRAAKRIDAKIAELPLNAIEIKEYVREANLSSLLNRVAYRVDGAHLYADILNLTDMLHVTEFEGETCHRRTMRFLNLHYRAVHRILQRVDAMLVDFVLAQTGEDTEHPAAKVRVGIDTGEALAVNNGRRGHREPLFLGEPANYAAKCAAGGNTRGIYLTSKARTTIGLGPTLLEYTHALTAEQIKTSQDKAHLGVTADEIVKQWKDDLANNPIGKFEFSGHTPPFADLDIESLAVKNSRRQYAATVYADLDGFTAYVANNIITDYHAKHVVRTLHVLRSELDAVLHTEFAGRKVRFIGDSVHGLLVEGTAQTTDREVTIANMTLCAGAMRSSFNLALGKLAAAGTDASSLGLAIGFDYGPMTVTRLGMKGELIRCSVSRGVLSAEFEQQRCTGRETAIGLDAYFGNDAVQYVFNEDRKRTDLTYDLAVEVLSRRNDKAAKAAQAMGAAGLLKPATPAAASYTFPDRATGPAKRDGFS